MHYDELIGQVVLYKTVITNDTVKIIELLLSPICKNPDFYHKIGFSPTNKYEIFHIRDKDKNAEWSMARELEEGYLKNIKGTINTN